MLEYVGITPSAKKHKNKMQHMKAKASDAA